MATTAILSGLIGFILIVAAIAVVAKGVLTKKELTCPKNHWTRIINNFATGMPQEFHVKIETDDGRPFSGEFMEQRFLWIIPQNPVTGGLSSEMKFERHWINARYIVSIKPSEDVRVKIS